jgi:putative aldouronate transport system permease protein
MLFSGGLIPTFLMVKETGLLHSIWSLILPGAVPVFNIVLMLNFFRSLPKELEEASFIDGAGHLKTLWKVYLPLAVPGIATISLFSMVGHWNAWFDGLIYMRNPEDYPLSTYMQSIMKFNFLSTGSLELAKLYADIDNRSIKAAQTFVSVIPILMVYPFLQKYFISGLVLGSVKE